MGTAYHLIGDSPWHVRGSTDVTGDVETICQTTDLDSESLKFGKPSAGSPRIKEHSAAARNLGARSVGMRFSASRMSTAEQEKIHFAHLV